MATVTIILPTYNRRVFLEEAVTSILDQTYRDWELIIVDDGSTDDSVSWVQSLEDARIVLVPHEHIGHIAILRNLGLARARGRWIAFQDSDDRWKPEKLERQLAYHAAHPELRWSYSAVDVIDVHGRPSVDARRKKWLPYRGDMVAPLLKLDALIALPSVLVDRGLLDEVGGFDVARNWVEDQDLWLRLAAKAECDVIEEPLVEIRAHESFTFARPETDLGFMHMYRSFAENTSDPLLRAIACRREAEHALNAADKLRKRGSWPEAVRAISAAMRIMPLAPFVYRGAARILWRQLRSAIESRPARTA